MRYTTRLIHESIDHGPLGRVTLAGFIADSPGVGHDRLRVFGSYALVYLLAGGGMYSDVNGVSSAVTAGDAILVFPELGHRYGPRAGDRWDELYIVFDGPAFNLLRAEGLLDPRRPVVRLGEVDAWLPRLLQIAEPALTNLPAQQLHRVGRLVSVLGAAVLDNAAERQDAWLSHAMELLRETDPAGAPLDLLEISDRLGVTYTAFRKRFTRQAGVPPARWRAALAIEQVKALLRDPDNTLSRIAAQLGFADEFHLSRRFKQIAGITPREYRRLLESKA
jgi:AraC-like DNA-binding protein